ncbi:MAG TPA: lysophospholipid acyltransferase family protein [Stellaceae bacterium]|nr:lysophospholipid acyltransferase family protein [Stellaceae bacterium]
MGSPTLRIIRIVLYLAWTASLMPVQGLGLLLRRPWTSRLPVLYHRWCCHILGFRVRSIGRPSPLRPLLFTANHVSYADITILGSLLPASFIAKAEVANWPLFGWLAKLQRSVFVDRRVGSTTAQRDALRARLAKGEALILFAEGTSSDGNRVLPFKSALFDAAQHSVGGAPVAVQPVSIAYTRLDGIPLGRDFRPFFAWYGAMSLGPHLWSMLGLGTVETVVEFHSPISFAECGSRKALARYCQERVASGVAAALSGHRQPPPLFAPSAQSSPSPPPAGGEGSKKASARPS